MKQDWKKERAKHAKHARLMAKRPELREALYGSMSPAMRKHWERPVDPPNILQQARDRAIGLDKLYPAQTRETAQKET